jgi:hypothetical protein
MDITTIYEQTKQQIQANGALNHGWIYMESANHLATMRIPLRDPHRTHTDKLLAYYFLGRDFSRAHPEMGLIKTACLIEETSYIKRPGMSYFEEDLSDGRIKAERYDCLAMQMSLDEQQVITLATAIPPNLRLGSRISVHYSCIERKPLYAFLAGCQSAEVPESFLFRRLFETRSSYLKEEGISA